MKNLPTNRIVAIGSSLCLLAMALMPVIANFDWRSTVGICTGIAAIAAVVYKWLHGWQLWEAPQAALAAKELTADPTDKRSHGTDENSLSDAEAIPNV